MSAHKFLNDYYLYRKGLDAKFSYEIWGVEMGFRSKSSLRMVCSGERNISRSFLNNFSRKNNLNSKEKEHFDLLANYQNATESHLKKLYLDKIIEQVDFSENISEIKDSAKFLASPILPLLQLIISFEDLTATEAVLQKITGLKEPELKNHLTTLQELGLAQSNQTGIWTSKAKSFKVPDLLQDETIKLYHLDTLNEARQILNQQMKLKKFKSLFFSLAEEDFLDLSEVMDSFISKLKVKYGNSKIKQKRLFKINLQAYPVTDKPE